MEDKTKVKKSELNNDFDLGIEEPVAAPKVVKESQYEEAVRVRITWDGVKDLVKGGVFVRGQVYSLAKDRADKILRNGWGIPATNDKVKK